MRAHWALVRAHFRSQTTYRASFVLDLVTNAAATVLDVLAVAAMFQVAGLLGAFTLPEVLVMVGMSSAAFATADLLVGEVEHLKRLVRTGLFDAILIRPLGTLTQLISTQFALRRLSRCGLGLVVYALALRHAEVTWTLERAALAVLAPAAAVVFFSALFVAGAAVAFWWIESGELSASITYGGRDFTAYPMTVYGGWFRRVFAYGLGFAFVAYYPALGLLGRADPLGAPAWAAWASPVVAAVAALLAAAVWRMGTRHYRSTGS